MRKLRITVVGGGAAGVFAAIAAAEANPRATVRVLEKGTSFLTKVRISGGGRCNVTHACFDPREFSLRYPRGSRELIGPLHQFQARDTVQWFQARGVRLKTEKDGRMFPVTDSSETVINALTGACRALNVALISKAEVQTVEPRPDKTLTVTLKDGKSDVCDQLLIATGGMRSTQTRVLLEKLGHSIEPPVPSLFTFHVEVPWLRALAGVSLPDVTVSVAGPKRKERGPLLATHWGISGPAILKLSAWAARELHELNYRFTVGIDWLPNFSREDMNHELAKRRKVLSSKIVARCPIQPVPLRLWEKLVASAGIQPTTRWAELSSKQTHAFVMRLKHTEFPVTGKSMNKEEFVTCGGVRLREVNFKTMESRITPNLYFAGEALDIDGITGGFNFQAAWTTGWIAGRNMAVV